MPPFTSMAEACFFSLQAFGGPMVLIKQHALALPALPSFNELTPSDFPGSSPVSLLPTIYIGTYQHRTPTAAHKAAFPLFFPILPSLARKMRTSSYNAVDLLVPLLVLAALPQFSLAARHLTALVEKQPLVLAYHKGRLLSGPISLNLIWYGHFTPSQRAIVTDFLASLSSSKKSPPPSVSDWGRTTEKYYHQLSKSTLPVLTPGAQTFDESCSLGKQLTSAQIAELAARGGGKKSAISVVLTAEDVAVEGFCMSRCGTHGSLPRSRRAYIWVGNSASQCPGQCAWPFHQPVYGPQSAPLVAPNGDVGVEGMVMNLASLLAGTVTNPYGNGYFQGPREAPLEAASACTGIYGKGAYPGYAGDLLVDPVTGGSYNARGVNGRKYLLPALVDPSTSDCKTLV